MDAGFSYKMLVEKIEGALLALELNVNVLDEVYL
jgi:hypothetical protein